MILSERFACCFFVLVVLEWLVLCQKGGVTMIQSRPLFAELSRLFERQLVAQRGLEVTSKCGAKACLLTGADRKLLTSLCQLFDELSEGEQILTGNNVTNNMIDASIALQEVISLMRDRRSVTDFVQELKKMKMTVSTLLEGHKPRPSGMRTLKTFLTSLAQTVGQELEESIAGRTAVPF